MAEEKEMVNHPKHYNRGDIEAIEVIEDWNLYFSVGSAVKYISRLGAKDDEIQELEKAKWYLNRVMETNKGVMVGEADRKYEPYKVSKDWKLNDTLTKALGAIYWGQFILAIKYIDEEIERRKKMIKVKYLDKDITKLEKTEKGDLIDLRVSSMQINDIKYDRSILKNIGSVPYSAGDVITFGFGVAMELPKGFKANVYPRSSLFKNYGLILTNSVGQIDNSYNGDEDEWKGMFIALRDGKVSYNDRLLQFDISPVWIKKDDLVEVEILGNENRGGYGTTGVK